MARVSPVTREGLEARPRERAVAHLWRNAHALSDGLKGEDGRLYRVLYPGRLSSAAGPDFRDSVIVTESGDVMTGDVELHLDAPDWNSHRHNVDPNYNGVILHVVLHPKGVKSSGQESGTRAPVISLGPVKDELAGMGRPGLESLGRIREAGQPALELLLDRAGDERFQARSVGYALTLGPGDAEQELYGALMEGLGYSANRKPFRELSRLVPVRLLASLRGEPGATRLLAIDAMLLRGAGLLDRVEPGELRAQMRAMLRQLPRTKAMDAGSWRLFRVRPANHPVRRIAGAAHLIDRHIETGLVRGLEEHVKRGGARHLAQRLMAPPLIGSARAREIAGSVVLPFLHALAGLRRDSDLRALCQDVYRELPGPGDNEITREMKRLLSPEIGPVRTGGARRHQGLIHLYKSMVAIQPA